SFHAAPGAARQAEPHPLAGAALLANHFAHLLQLVGHALISGDDIVEGTGNLADDAIVMTGNADGEIAAPHGVKGMKEQVKLALPNRSFDRKICSCTSPLSLSSVLLTGSPAFSFPPLAGPSFISVSVDMGPETH